MMYFQRFKENSKDNNGGGGNHSKRDHIKFIFLNIMAF